MQYTTLSIKLGKKTSLKEQGVDGKDFMFHVKEITYLAYEVQCTTAYPKVPLVKNMIQILKDANYGNFKKGGK